MYVRTYLNTVLKMKSELKNHIILTFSNLKYIFELKKLYSNFHYQTSIFKLSNKKLFF